MKKIDSINPIILETFKKGSKTYFNTSIFFPAEIRKDVFKLYAFLRKADNFVDRIPQDKEGFYNFWEKYEKARTKNIKTGNIIIDSFLELSKDKRFNDEWVDAFFSSMEMDLNKKLYNSQKEVLEYVYGSAEVIGLFMVSIMKLPKECYHSAKMLGRSMQYINFIRDIKEDRMFGRRYLPLNGTKLKELTFDEANNNKEEFKKFIRRHISLYQKWQKEAEKGFSFLKKRFLIPIKTASNMYLWTSKKILKQPLIVFKEKVKPSKVRILLNIFKNFLV